MSLEGFRVPLQEQKLEVNTPFHKNINPKITTPPGSSFMSKNHPNSMGNYYNPSHYDHNDDIDTSLTMETPVKTYDINRNLLLSPAFSSPQNFNNHFYNHDNVQKPPQMQSHSQPQYQEIQTTDIQQIQQQQQHLQQNYQMNLQNDSAQHSTVGISDIEKKRKKSKPKKAFDFQSSDKPPYSYATLIGLSILSHPEKRLTLSSIYQWISDTFKYYKREDVGWQNSIRHNLSLNKAFIKGEKSKDGKGHFWCIQNGFEDQFLKSRNNKNGSYHEIMEQINQNSRKASINSIPSSPNYYDINSSIMSNDKLDESFNSQTTVDDNNKKDDEKHQDNEEQEDKENFQSNKRQKTELGEPFIKTPKQSVTSATFENIKSMSTPSFDLINSTPKLIVTESPNKPLVASKNLTFTSSFSCNSNLELSPIRPNETGPLLEPLTPGRIYKNGAVNHHLSINYQNQPINNAKINFDKVFAASTIASSTTTLSKVIEQQTHQQQQQSSTQPQYQPQQPPHHQAPTHLHPDHNDTMQKFNGLRTPKNNIKTPLRILKTPNTSFKKFWNSPNYLDDFYYSPLITSNSALHSYDDDDMILRAFESPANNQKVLHKRKLSNSLSKN